MYHGYGTWGEWRKCGREKDSCQEREEAWKSWTWKTSEGPEGGGVGDTKTIVQNKSTAKHLEYYYDTRTWPVLA